ncbi:hypothetical protein DENIT_13036 [Pseudomonas veronii]|nr:hypothetical protein DENIT_13036 [Pseudomonas veronii]
MATVDRINFSPHDPSIKYRLITYSSNSPRVVIEGLPQIFWVDGLPRREANFWLWRVSPMVKHSLFLYALSLCKGEVR